jgi:lysozyme
VIPEQAIELVAEFEGFRSHVYLCPAGVRTIGYGTTQYAGRVIPPGLSISEPVARNWLRADLERFGDKIRPLIKVALSVNEWAAILSLAYNIGPSAFRRSSVLRNLNAGERLAAADSFLMWKKANGKVLKGLVRRREAERKLFLQP